jgi:alpha-glucosidase (family GH31 glycosyl hydrolase)
VEHIRGPALLDRSVPLDEIPVYVRSSAIKDLLNVFTRGSGPT